MRTFISLAVVVVAVLTSIIFNTFYYSPVSGVVTANTLNGGANEYAIAKFVSGGGIDSAIALITLAVLFFVWLSPILKSIRSKSN